MAAEYARMRAAALVGEKSGLFAVPPAVRYDADSGILTMDRIGDLMTIRQLAVKRHESLLECLSFAGAALATVHRDLRESPRIQLGAATFSFADITDFHGFASKLRRESDKVSELLWGQLSGSTKALLTAFTDGKGDPVAPHAAVIKDLNALVSRSLIYSETGFVGVQLSDATMHLLSRKRSGKELVRLNRMLLQDAYPLEISANPLFEVQQLFTIAPEDGVFLHGDFTADNVGFSARNNQLFIFDWSSAPLLGEQGNFGSRYFDLVWFTAFLFQTAPAHLFWHWPSEKMAGTFLQAYTAELGFFDSVAYARSGFALSAGMMWWWKYCDWVRKQRWPYRWGLPHALLVAISRGIMAMRWARFLRREAASQRSHTVSSAQTRRVSNLEARQNT